MKQAKQQNHQKQNQQKQTQQYTRACADCKTDFSQSQKNVCVCYCVNCRKPRSADLIELAYVKDEEYIVLRFDNAPDAEQCLRNMGDVPVRVDLEKTLNLLPIDEKIVRDGINVAIISFVGSITETREGASIDIKNRINSGQATIGILVFKRGKRGTPEANTYVVPGSKAWTNNCLPFNDVAVFCDDADDHIESVDSLGLPNLETCLIVSANNLRKSLGKFK